VEVKDGSRGKWINDGMVGIQGEDQIGRVEVTWGTKQAPAKNNGECSLNTIPNPGTRGKMRR
jgi:hypothetical protein